MYTCFEALRSRVVKYTYVSDVFFAQTWQDHRLILPENMTREYRLLPLEFLNKIWRPDSYFKNAKKVTFQTMTIQNHYLWLYKDKTILYMVKLTLLLSCAMHFQKYPHDEQLCKLSMESLSHTTDDLIFEWLPEKEVPLAVDEGIQLPQLELINNSTGDCTSVYSTGNFTCLEVIFKFKRRLGYYLFHTYIPTCLIVMMSWISFWIKPEAVPARVTLGVTSLLTLSTQHANSQKSLPPVSYIKAIDIFMSSCTFFVFFSLIEYAFVNVMLGDISDVERKDKTSHLRNILVTANANLPVLSKHPSQQPYTLQDGNYKIATGDGQAHPLLLEQATLQTVGSGQLNNVGDQTRLFGGQDGGHCPKHGGGPGGRSNSTSADDVILAGDRLMLKNEVGNAQIVIGQLVGPADSTSIGLNMSSEQLRRSDSVATAGGPGNTILLPNSASMAGLTAAPSGNGGMPPPPPGEGGPPPPADGPPKDGGESGDKKPEGKKKEEKKGGKKVDPKDIMKKRRERAICIDKVSRVVFPSTFILLNIMYWLIFGDILETIKDETGIGGGGH